MLKTETNIQYVLKNIALITHYHYFLFLKPLVGGKNNSLQVKIKVSHITTVAFVAFRGWGRKMCHSTHSLWSANVAH